MFAERGYLDRQPTPTPPPLDSRTVRPLSKSRAARDRRRDWLTVDADVGQHLQQLCARLAADRDMPRNVSLSFTPSSARMQEVMLNRLSLIAAELITGSIRYGFPSGRGGRIGLALDAWPWGWELTIEDTGTTADSRGSGMGKVRHLVLSLGATLDLSNVIGGHRWVVTVPSIKNECAETFTALGALMN